MLSPRNNESISGAETESLVDRAVSGDTEAFGRLFDLYADNIYRHIYYRTGNMQDAQDLTQEVFARAWKVLPKYRRTKTPFLGWLFTISRNRVIDYYRTKKDHSYLNNEILQENSESNPEKLIESKFTQHEIRKAILQLPEDQQQAILMSFIEGFDYPEIARTMNKTEGNIRVIIHRGLKKMREILGQAED